MVLFDMYLLRSPIRHWSVVHGGGRLRRFDVVEFDADVVVVGVIELGVLADIKLDGEVRHGSGDIGFALLQKSFSKIYIYILNFFPLLAHGLTEKEREKGEKKRESL